MERREFLENIGWTVAGTAVALPELGAVSEDKPAASVLPFSVMLWTVEPNLPFAERIAKVAEAGFHAVQLVEEYKDWLHEDFARARKQLQGRQVIVDACSGIHASLVDPAQRDALLLEIRAKLPVLVELNCSRLILLTGDKVPGMSHEEMRASCGEALKRAAEITSAGNVQILLENIDPEENPKYFLTSVAEGFGLVRELDLPGVRFLYDFYHEQISEGNLIAKLAKNIDLIGLVHVADVPGRHEPGTGEINYASIFRKLGELDYKGNVAMEFMPTGDVVSALRAAREFAEKYLAEGRAHTSRILPRELNHA
jgi:hydroxypyruvate isomerase